MNGTNQKKRDFIKLIKINKMERDFNKEFKDNAERKYAYNFDFDVMHKFMIKSFEPFFKYGNLLDMGSF